MVAKLAEFPEVDEIFWEQVVLIGAQIDGKFRACFVISPPM